jgi:hypothetical protein
MFKPRHILACAVLLLVSLLVSLLGCAPSVQGAVNPARYSALQRVALLPFDLPDGAPPGLSQAFADEMSAHLGGARFQIVDPVAVRNAWTNQDIQGTDLADPRVAARVGEIMGADAVLIGRVLTYEDHATNRRLDTTLAVSIKIVDVRTREIILSTTGESNAGLAFCAQDMGCLRDKVLTAVGRFIIRGGDEP